MRNEQQLTELLEEGFNFKPVSQCNATKAGWKSRIEFLLNDDARLEYLFLDFLYEQNTPIGMSVSKLRNFARLEGRGKDVTEESLNVLIANRDYEGLLKEIEELFLEPISRKWYMNKLENALHSGISGQDIINWHKTGQRHIALLAQPSRALRVHYN